MIKLYGTSKSRANRCLWALEELGLDYEHIPVNFGEESHRPAYLAINPNGRVPALDDNGVILWESIAINLYLADKYGTAPLWPHNPDLRGKCYQWSLWAVNEIEPRVYTLMAHRVWKPPGQRDQTAVRRAIEELIEPFRILNDALKGGSYLVGGAFSIADLNVASISRAQADSQPRSFTDAASGRLAEEVPRSEGVPARAGDEVGARSGRESGIRNILIATALW